MTQILTTTLQLIVVFLAGSLAFATFYLSEVREWHITFRTMGPSVYSKTMIRTVEALTESGSRHRLIDEERKSHKRIVVVVSIERGERVREIVRRQRIERSNRMQRHRKEVRHNAK